MKYLTRARLMVLCGALHDLCESTRDKTTRNGLQKVITQFEDIIYVYDINHTQHDSESQFLGDSPI